MELELGGCGAKTEQYRDPHIVLTLGKTDIRAPKLPVVEMKAKP